MGRGRWGGWDRESNGTYLLLPVLVAQIFLNNSYDRTFFLILQLL